MDYYSGLILGLTAASSGRNVGDRASSKKIIRVIVSPLIEFRIMKE